MPPKQEAKNKKIVEDKTFGLKNKNKSKKVQQFVKNVEAQVKFTGKSHKQVKEEEKAREMRALAKQMKAEEEKQKAALFGTVVNKQVIPLGVDPKSVLCEFFKAGKCVRGNKCKFSHDLNQARKTTKIDLYSDPRLLGEAGKEADTIDKWDTNKLSEVVALKEKGRLPPTNIICKFFLDAVENGMYGWRWECENGKDCHYRHALPPGYILKTKAEKEREKDREDEEEPKTVEELIEEERMKLDLSKCTPLTLELFGKWKLERANKKVEEAKEKGKAAQKSGGSGSNNQMSGRDLFRFDPSLFIDDEAADDEKYVIQSDEEEEDEEKGVGAGVGDEDEKEGDDEDLEVNEQHEAGEVEETAKAINEDLFLDEDVPDGDEDEDEDGEEEEEEEEKDS